MTRSTAVWAAILSTVVAGPVLGAGAERKILIRGAEASAPVRARSVDVDLRDLPLAPDWEPGDPIKEIPRRHNGPPLFTGEPERTFELDPLLQDQDSAQAPVDAAFSAPVLNFAGQGFSGVNPPDTVGDVSPSHYIQMINKSGGASFTIYDKNGSLVAGPTMLDSLGTGDCASGLGDPIVLYDQAAGRWLLSEFSNAGNKLCVFVSKTSDPISGGWWAYAFQAPSFPDYPKYGVWPDAYYVGANESSPSVYALDRARMLNGQAATSQRFSASSLAGFSFQMLQPADLDGASAPPAGANGIFMRHRDDEAHNAGSNNPSQDFLEIFEFHVNWTTPANSTFSGPTSIATAEFDSSLCGLTSFNCIPQPGSSTTLDPLREVVMNRLQYRNFGSHQTLVGNLVTDVNGSDRAGVRWFELRKTGAAWALQQQGTYSPDATNRWMASAAMDGSGNLAIGYSVSSSSVAPGIRYAGRLSTDPAGTLPQGESTLIAGTSANGSNRWGDYAALTVDPADDCTFWFTTQYSPSSSWATRIGSFKFDQCGAAPSPDFSVACSPASLSVQQGNSGASTCTVTSTGGFASAVSLACSGLPSGASCSFSPASVTPPANGSAASALTVTVAGATPTGTYSVSVNGTSGASTRSAGLSLTVTGTGPGDQAAAYDATLRAPRCGTVGRSCDSGAALLLGRNSKGPEPNQPNTINTSCADGNSGTFHSDESNDRIRVSTTDGTGFAAGKTVRIDATVWAYSSFSSDKLDLYYAANANSPAWTLVGTLTPTAAGASTLSATYTLPAGTLQAVRARFRYNGSAAACGTGSYDDHDDLVFAVGGTAPTPDFSVACAPSSLSAVQGGSASSTCTVSSTNGFASAVSLGCSGLPSGASCGFSPASVTPPANGSAASALTVTVAGTTATGSYNFTVNGTSGSTTRSASLSLTVSGTAGDVAAAYDATRKAPRCGTVGRSCDSGAALLRGRNSKGPEPNQPNTINATCADGNSGTFHSDESNDRIKVSTSDGTGFAAGKTVRVDATVWAWTTPSSDKLDLYYAANASSPSWTLIATLTPASAGASTLSATYTLPSGTLQAVRARFRYQGSASACGTGSYDDHDDLIFSVNP